MLCKGKRGRKEGQAEGGKYEKDLQLPGPLLLFQTQMHLASGLTKSLKYSYCFLGMVVLLAGWPQASLVRSLPATV